MNCKSLGKQLARKVAGKFLVFDGPDGCGKSTQLRLLAEELDRRNVPPVRVRDPGDTRVGDAIRAILLGRDHEDREIRCELMLFMASRAQLVAEKIRPALAAGKTVLCDRYVSASCAYQGAGGVKVSDILDLAQFATRNTWPDLTVVLDVPAQLGLQRVRNQRQDTHDAMERRGLDYHERVRDLFLKLPQIYPKPVVVVDARAEIEAVRDRIWEALANVDY